jgi:predicted phosphodiesterase
MQVGRFSIRSAKSTEKYDKFIKKLEEVRDDDYRIIEEVYTPLSITDNNVLVAPDWHGTRHDKQLKNLLYKIAEEEGVKTLVIPGDFFDCDAYSTFIRFNHEISFKTELRNAAKILAELVSRFKNVYFTRGNHEKRWMSLNQGMMGMEELFACTGIAKGYKVTLDDHLILKSGAETWRVCHPKEFSRTPGKVPRELAKKYQMNIFGAHGHRMGWWMDDTGRFQCVEGGGLFNKDKIEYLRDTSCYSETNPGFWLIRDGWCHPFPDKRKW